MVAGSGSPIQTLFDRISPVYDHLNAVLSLGQHRIWKQMAVKWSQPPQGGHCLDLCCGSGDLAQLLARRVGPTGVVCGVDFAPQQLEIAQRRSQASPLQASIDWVEADVLQLPFADQTFDAITMGYGLRNVVDIPACLREIHRVLKPHCRAAILDLNHPTHAWVKAFQHWYLQTIVVPVATQYGLNSEYAYLEASLQRFPPGAEQVQMAMTAGFSQAIHYPIAGGTMGVLVVTKLESFKHHHHEIPQDQAVRGGK